MVRTSILVLAVGLFVPGMALGQSIAWQFRPETDKAWLYRVEHVTAVTEVIEGKKNVTRTRLNLVKRWKSHGAEKGKAGFKMELVLDSLRMETTKVNGETLLFDSANLEKSTPALKDQLGKLVGKTMAVLRVAGDGRVLEVIESKHGPASRFECELPFQLAVPGAIPKPGQSWRRPCKITLAPPHGTGEKYDAAQKFTCKEVAKGKALITVSTTIDKLPESTLDQIPLVQMQPDGEVVFDFQAGRMLVAKLRINKQLKNHQGAGSSYHFQSVYSEEYVEEK